ncbi:MAG: phosphatase PAP2 family protein [Lachnospiraceae bacterium]|nr:phosphatase PAP2 family protein [Lachnospiraceae bacterium]
MEKKKTSLITAIVLTLITILYTVLVWKVDRAPIGPEGTWVGFSSLNGSFRDAIGTNLILDKVTDVFMGLAIITAASFAVIGFIQLVRRKSLLKVDKPILGLAGVYVVIAAVYVGFDKFAINYRPVLLPGENELESSFPSSHVLVICAILCTAIFAWNRILAYRKKLLTALKIAAIVVMAAGFCGRLISGVHWLTDIIAGALYALWISSVYIAVMDGLGE